MFGKAPPQITGEAHLDTFAAWVTSPENPRFTTVVVNRLWKRLFGLANIEPLDELMDSTVPVIPALQKELEQHMKALRYDLKAFLRTLLNTRAYQAECLRAEIAAGDTSHFIGPILRRMSAEQAWDSLVTLINVTPDVPNRITRDYLRRSRAIGRDSIVAQRLMTSDEIFEGVKTAAATYVQNAQTTQRLQKELEAAKAAGDKELVRQISRQMTTVENNQRDAVRTHVHIPAAKKLAAKEKRVIANFDGPDAGLQGSDLFEKVYREFVICGRGTTSSPPMRGAGTFRKKTARSSARPASRNAPATSVPPRSSNPPAVAISSASSAKATAKSSKTPPPTLPSPRPCK